MSPADGSGPAPPSTARFAELLAGMAPLERIERLAVIETLSYGTVYEGRVFRASRAEPVSLLELDPALEAGSAYPPILRNLLAASRIRSANILSPRGLYRDADSLYALYEAQPGLSLATGLEYLHRSGLRLSAEAVLRIASGVLQALDELEREDAGAPTPGAGERLRSHGLLIPENLYVTDDQRVLVRGIGIWQSGIAQTGRLGARERRYLAPLQSAQGKASARSDLISLGAILFEASAGFPAFDTPPSEEDLAELNVRIDEIGARAEDARRELFGIAHACLSAMAVTPASRGRLRVTVDTMFLREAARERVPGCVTLEDLAGRVKATRPAIVKAIALDLDPIETMPKPVPPPPPLEPPALAAAEDGADSGKLGLAEPPQAAAAPTPASSEKRPFEVHLSRQAALGGLVAAFLLVAAIGLVLLLRPKPAPRAEPAGGEEAAANPSSPAIPATPMEAPTVLPAAGADSRTSAEIAGQRAAAMAAPGSPLERPRARALASKGSPRRNHPAPSASAPERPAPADEPALPAIAPGTLVTLGEPGLLAPVLSVRPEDPRLSPSDPRPASPGSVQLQLLVDESGRVLDHRILGASRFPPGVTSSVATYIAALRFRPAELRGVPVRVWIRHDMRFWAP